MPKKRKRKTTRKGVKRDYTYDIYAEEDKDPELIRVLEALRQYRLTRTQDIQYLLNTSKSTAYRKMDNLRHNKLIANEYLDPPNRKKGGQRLDVHYLTRGGFQLLLQERQKKGLETPFFAPISPDMSQAFMRHTLGITQSMIRFQVATEQLGWSIHGYKNEWFFKVKRMSKLRDERAKSEKIALKVEIESGLTHKHGKKQGQPKMMNLYLEPDNFIVIKSPYGTVPLFHEHDRTTETEEKWQQKIRAYNVLYQTGLFEHLFGWQGFRVVTTVHSKHKTMRLNNLIEYTEKIPHIGTRFWFIHEDDIDSQTVLTDPVWKRALSHKAKTQNKSRMATLVRPPRPRK